MDENKVQDVMWEVVSSVKKSPKTSAELRAEMDPLHGFDLVTEAVQRSLERALIYLNPENRFCAGTGWTWTNESTEGEAKPDTETTEEDEDSSGAAKDPLKDVPPIPTETSASSSESDDEPNIRADGQADDEDSPEQKRIAELEEKVASLEKKLEQADYDMQVVLDLSTEGKLPYVRIHNEGRGLRDYTSYNMSMLVGSPLITAEKPPALYIEGANKNVVRAWTRCVQIAHRQAERKQENEKRAKSIEAMTATLSAIVENRESCTDKKMYEVMVESLRWAIAKTLREAPQMGPFHYEVSNDEPKGLTLVLHRIESW